MSFVELQVDRRHQQRRGQSAQVVAHVGVARHSGEEGEHAETVGGPNLRGWGSPLCRVDRL
eukprot:7184273-Lingulodinium_polyedra.AAC.1